MRKTLTAILCAMLIFSGAVAMAGNGAQGADVAAGPMFTGGSGTTGDPFQISNVTQLQWMGNLSNLDKHFVLVNDIDASETGGWNGGEGFLPIGDVTNPFVGTLNGNNFTITGLTINRIATNVIGLFSYLDYPGLVENIILTDANVVGWGHASILVAFCRGGEITNCHVNGTVTGNSEVGGVISWLLPGGGSQGKVINCTRTGNTYGGGDRTGGFIAGVPDPFNYIGNCSSSGKVNGNYYVGGFVGHAMAPIDNSHSEGDVTGSENNIGGFVGYNDGGTITNCSSTGNANGNNWVGGFAGENSGTITNCSSTGNANGGNETGGFTGYNFGGIITNCYSSGNANGTGENVGGFAGFNSDTGIITKCYSTGNASGIADYTGGFAGANIGTIAKCYSTGNSNGHWMVGGFVGVTGVGPITNCYSTGNASTITDYVGGFAGAATSAGTITNCYSTGFVSGNSPVGGFAGWDDTAISGCFWDTETSGLTSSANGTGKTTSDMVAMATFASAGWDFADIWAIKDTYTYPFFRWNYWNDAPTASDNHHSTGERVSLSVAAPGVLANDNDPDLHAYAPDLRDTLAVMNYTPTSAFGATITMEADGSFTYDPTGAPDILALGAGETLVDTFTYTVSDGKGGTDTAMVHVTVTGVNHAPTTVNHLHETDEDTLLLVPADGLLAGVQDSDGDHITAVPGSFTNAKGAIIIINADGSFSYDPRPSAAMQALAVGEWAHDSFTYMVMDIHGAMAIGTVTVNVTGANDAPEITSGNLPECIEGVPYSVDYTAIDIDGDSLAWAVTTNATWLTMSTAGTLSGTPEPGIIAVSVTVSDGHGGSDWSNFTLTAYVDSNGNGIPDYRDPEFLTSTVWVNETVWQNQTVWNNQTIPEYHNTTIPEYHNSTVWNNQTVPEYHNTTVWSNGTAQAETPLWAWAAVIAAVAMGAVAVALAVRRPGGKKPDEPGQNQDSSDQTPNP